MSSVIFPSLAVKPATTTEKTRVKNFYACPRLWDTDAIAQTVKRYQEENPVDNQSRHYEQVDLGSLCCALKAAGFISVVDEVTVQAEYNPRLERVMLWAHPSGALFTGSTYQYSSTAHERDQWVSGQLSTHINLGYGNMGYDPVCVMRSSASSSGGHISGWGESVHHRHTRVDSIFALMEELDQCQRTGAIVPFDEMSPKDTWLFLDEKIFLPQSVWSQHTLEHLSEDACKKDLQNHTQKIGQTFWNTLVANIPHWNALIPGLGNVIAAGCSYLASPQPTSGRQDLKECLRATLAQAAFQCPQLIIPKRHHNGVPRFAPQYSNPPSTILDFREVENATDFIGQMGAHSLQRYLSTDDRAIAQKLLHALKNHRQGQWTKGMGEERLSNGIGLVHLCAALDTGTEWIANETRCLTLQAIADTPTEILRDMCTHPLPDGNTLPLSLVQLAQQANQKIFFRRKKTLVQQLPEVLAALHHKVPADQWNLGEGNTNTLNGLRINEIAQLCEQRNSHADSRAAHQHHKELLENLGARIPEHFAIKIPLRRNGEARSPTLLPPKEVCVSEREEAWDAVTACSGFKKDPERYAQALNYLLHECVQTGAAEPAPLTKRKM